MLSNEVKINEVDKYVYVKNIYKDHVIVCLYVDDILILNINDYMIKITKKILINKFNIKNLGVADVIIEIKFFLISNRLLLSQYHYVEKILENFSKNNNNTIKTLIDISVYLSKNSGKRINQLKYSWIIGSLMYVMNHTRLDVAYSISKLSRFTSNPNIDQWMTIKRVFMYLR